MNRSNRVARTAFVVLAAAVGVIGIGSSASAQRRARVGYAASPPPPPPQITTPYPGATVTVDPRLYQLQSAPQSRRHQAGGRVVYVPVPYYPAASYGGGGVTDANGRPLYTGAEAPAPIGFGYGLGTPDLTGSPYVARQDGAMVVDFGNDDVRTIPSCAAQASAKTPEGQPRTIFYRPGTEGVILRAGQRGRVQGVPGAGAGACYTTDGYGRMALAY
jgi:hypothetical protein